MANSTERWQKLPQTPREMDQQRARCQHPKMKAWSQDHALPMGLNNCPDCGLFQTAGGKHKHYAFAEPEALGK